MRVRCVDHPRHRCVNCVEVLKPRYIQHRMRRIAFESGAVTLEQLMSRGQKPLLLMMALSMPGTGHALGLGDIHVNSKLNEPLTAEIDIVGATADELMGLRASLANRETFQRFGFERPAFLSSTTFKVTQNGQGRPVLMVRSSESFTDPLVSILVDMNWGNGELVREYTLLLDPAGFGADRAAAEVAAPVIEAVPAIAIAATAVTATPAGTAHDADGTQSTERKVSRYKIGAKATLRGIAWRAGARSKSDLNRLMIAIFRANPSAFEGNINRLRRGAFVNIPGATEVSAIPRVEANREIRAQMAAWHAAGKPAPTRALAAVAVPAAAVAAAAVADAAPVDTAPAPASAATKAAEIAATAALNLRIQSLEQSLDAVQRELKSENETMRAVQQQVRRTEEPTPIAEAAPEPVQSRSSVLAAIIAGVGTLCAAIAAGYFAMLRRATKLKSKESLKAKAQPATVERAAEQPANVDLPLEFYPQDSFAESSVPAGDSSPTAEMPAISAATAGADGAAVVSDETRPLPVLANPDASPTVALPTVVLPVIADATLRLPATGIMPDREVLDLFSDTQHVNMPSALHEQSVMKERRTNLVDVLRTAIERDPERHDLRLKLLELYFGAATTNRRGFLDVVQKFAQERAVLPDGEWERIVSMGRQIVPDSPLFSEADDEQLADCA
jgi:pilus assembly protein FimV